MCTMCRYYCAACCRSAQCAGHRLTSGSQHIVLDNLQFMMSSSSSRGFERFEAQERALDKFRVFASARNVHVSLVIHPRKEADGAPLSMHSVFGTAKVCGIY